MADKEQLEILKQGASAWNAWRKATGLPILTSAYLSDLAPTGLGGAISKPGGTI
jgi:hypothetical protein